MKKLMLSTLLLLMSAFSYADANKTSIVAATQSSKTTVSAKLPETKQVSKKTGTNTAHKAKVRYNTVTILPTIKLTDKKNTVKTMSLSDKNANKVVGKPVAVSEKAKQSEAKPMAATEKNSKSEIKPVAVAEKNSSSNTKSDAKLEIVPEKVNKSDNNKPDIKSDTSDKSKDNTPKDVRQSAIAKVEAAKQNAQKRQAVVNAQPEKVDGKENASGVLIQAGAFRTDALAESQMARVVLLGLPVKVVKVTDSKGNIIRLVRSRQRLNPAEAEKVVGRLEQNNVQAVLLSN